MLMLFAAAIASAQPAANVGFAELMRGEDSSAITAIAADRATEDPAQHINLAIAHARRGDTDLARKHFQAVIDRRETIELQTSTGAWIDARTIARRGIAMLDDGVFAAGGRMARK